jgi:hypothetical protein
VRAGLDQVIANTSSNATLLGSVIDNEPPFGSAVETWDQIDEPGTATFADTSLAQTTAPFDSKGTYLLQLTADEGDSLPVSDVMQVRVGTSTIVRASGLVAWWPGNGTTAEIVQGNSNVQRFNGMSYSSGQVSQSFCFTGFSCRFVRVAKQDRTFMLIGRGMDLNLRESSPRGNVI